MKDLQDQKIWEGQNADPLILLIPTSTIFASISVSIIASHTGEAFQQEDRDRAGFDSLAENVFAFMAGCSLPSRLLLLSTFAMVLTPRMRPFLNPECWALRGAWSVEDMKTRVSGVAAGSGRAAPSRRSPFLGGLVTYRSPLRAWLYNPDPTRRIASDSD